MNKSIFLIVVGLILTPALGFAQDAPSPTPDTVEADPVAAESVAADPVAAESVAADPVAAESVAADPVAAAPTPTEPVDSVASTAAHETPHDAATVSEPTIAESKWDYGGDESILLNYRLPRDVLEIRIHAGGNSTRQEVPVNADKTGGSGFGGYAAFDVTWRLDYIFSVFLEGSWAMMGSQKSDAKITDTETVSTDASLSATSVHAGLTLDVWYFSARFGFGSSSISNSVTVNGVNNSTSDLDFTYILGVGGTFYREGGLQLGLEMRAFFDPALTTGYMGLGLTGAYDVLSF